MADKTQIAINLVTQLAESYRRQAEVEQNRARKGVLLALMNNCAQRALLLDVLASMAPVYQARFDIEHHRYLVTRLDTGTVTEIDTDDVWRDVAAVGAASDGRHLARAVEIAKARDA